MKTALAVRTHRSSRKLESSLRALAGSPHYDLFLVANETVNQVEDFGVTKLSHTADIMAPFGDVYASESHLVHCSDAVFGFLHDRLPGYDFILVVEDDVHFPHGARQFVERILAIVEAFPDGLDLVATRVRKAEPDWWWYEEGKRSFSDVHAILFPFVGMSARTIEFLRQARSEEAGRAAGNRLVFCETFVPSALQAAGGFNIRDVNQLVPQAYGDDSFTIGLPQLLEDPVWASSRVEMAHPVFSAAEFLERRFAHARSPGGDVGAFLDDLEIRQAMIPAPLRTEYAARAGAHVNVTLVDRLARLERRLGLTDG